VKRIESAFSDFFCPNFEVFCTKYADLEAQCGRMVAQENRGASITDP
jgi:hypothetical protein